MKSNSRVYVIGHKNPDTDSICSAIAYADIKNRTDKTKTYMARRAGQINEETEYVLKRFGVRPPLQPCRAVHPLRISALFRQTRRPPCAHRFG